MNRKRKNLWQRMTGGVLTPPFLSFGLGYPCCRTNPCGYCRDSTTPRHFDILIPEGHWTAGSGGCTADECNQHFGTFRLDQSDFPYPCEYQYRAPSQPPWQHYCSIVFLHLYIKYQYLPFPDPNNPLHFWLRLLVQTQLALGLGVFVGQRLWFNSEKIDRADTIDCKAEFSGTELNLETEQVEDQLCIWDGTALEATAV